MLILISFLFASVLCQLKGESYVEQLSLYIKESRKNGDFDIIKIYKKTDPTCFT